MEKKFSAYSMFVNPPKYKGEVNNDKYMVSLAGYIPAEERIKTLIAAGKRLYEHQNAIYDVPSGYRGDIDSLPIDPTRSKEFGLEDASAILDDATKKYSDFSAKKKDELKKKQAEKAKKPAEKPVEEPEAAK